MAAVKPTAPKSYTTVDPYQQYKNAYAAQQQIDAQAQALDEAATDQLNAQAQIQQKDKELSQAREEAYMEAAIANAAAKNNEGE